MIPNGGSLPSRNDGTEINRAARGYVEEMAPLRQALLESDVSEHGDARYLIYRDIRAGRGFDGRERPCAGSHVLRAAARSHL